jgi:5-formyltetrahydrofolate cyclo-ligase
MEKEIRKKKFRRRCLDALKRASRQSTYIKDNRVRSMLKKLIEQTDARTIMLYLPLATEVDLYPLIRVLRRQGRQLYVPFMEGASFRLVKYRYPLKTKRFGIKEPKDSKQYRIKRLDIAIKHIDNLIINN